MEVILAIAKLIGVTLDDLFYKEIEDFQNDCAQQTFASKTFEKLSDQDIKLLYYIAQDLQIRRFGGNDETVDVFTGLIFIKSEKKEESINLVLQNKDVSFEKEVADLGKYEELFIEKWLQNIILKSLFRQKYIGGVSAFRTTNNEGFVVEVNLDLSEKNIEELFIEYAKRKATDIIGQAKIMLEDDDELLPL